MIEKLKTRPGMDKLIKIFIGSYLPLGLTLASFTPDNILEYRLARIFTELIESFIPFVIEVGMWTPVPATQFIAAVMNLAAISIAVLLAYYSIQEFYVEKIVITIHASPKKQITKFILGITFFVICFYFLIYLRPIGNPPSRGDCLMINSKLGMGLYGSMIISSWVLMAGSLSLIFSIYVYLKRRISGKPITDLTDNDSQEG